MDIFLKACAGVMVTLVLALTLGNKGKDIGTLLTLSVCCMVCISGLRYFQTVADFIDNLTLAGNLDGSLVEILLKVTGIGVISEIAVMICNDSGCSSLGKSLQILAAFVTLWLSIPVFSMILELVQTMLGDL